MDGSMETEQEGKNAAITAIRRPARVLTVIPVIFAGLLWLVAVAIPSSARLFAAIRTWE
jgi:hypothetical protein